MRRLATLLLAALLVSGCFWRLWGGGGEEGAVDDSEAVIFAQRAAEFYAQLEGVPLDTALTYQSLELHNYFAGRGAFNDYFASLATQIRRADLRRRAAERIEVREFRLVKPGEMVVDLTIYGRHQRRLRFWEMELERTDTWNRIGGTWIVTPDRL